MRKALVFTCIIFTFIACKKKKVEDVTNPPVSTAFAKGADVSWVTQMESSVIKCYNSSGTEQ